MQEPFIVHTDAAPAPRGHYAQAVVAGGLVFVAGQLPIRPTPGREIPEGIVAQTRQVLSNLDAVLAAAGSGPGQVVSLQVFITDAAFWADVNRMLADYFGPHRPARTMVPVLPLASGALVELNAVAARRS